MRIARGNQWFTVTGVSADVRQNRATAKALAPVVYLPSRSAPAGSFLVALRTVVPAESLADPARKAIQRLDEGMPVRSVMSMTEAMRLEHWPHRVFGSMFAILGLVAAALAGLGVYSVMAYSVGMRTQEMGLRMALGATGADIRGMVVSRGLRQVAVGLAIGLTGAAAVTRQLRALLVDVPATDPAAYFAMAAFLAGIALLACWVPARRAARVDPREGRCVKAAAGLPRFWRFVLPCRAFE